MKRKTYPKTRRHHLDRRADRLIQLGTGRSDDLLSTSQLAVWLGVSHQFLEISRLRGDGPPFVKVSSRLVRYRRSDVNAWLKERVQKSTEAYAS